MVYLLYGLLTVLALVVVILAIAWRTMVWMPGRPYQWHLPPLDEHQQQIRSALEHDLAVLADDIGERNVSHRYDQLIDAAEFIEQSLQTAGYKIRRQEIDVDGRTVWNIEAELRGSRHPDEVPSEVIVVGAHYDTVPGSPGANDNGSAVVANLALARAFASAKCERTIRFVFFVNEEAPYYMTETMGSLRYAQQCQANGDNVVGMICLETIGYYSNEPGSQRYPVSLLERLYPTTGNFITVVGNVRSRRLVHRMIRGLRRSPFPSQGMAAPRWLKDIFRSDHASFWLCGYPALMLTDTANFRYAYYHTADDTVDKINFDALAQLVTAIDRSLQELAGAGE